MADSGRPAEVMSLRPVNRALLARQLLLDRPRVPAAGPDRAARVVHTVEHLLSHAERSRVISPEATRRLYTINGVIPGAVLIDGFVAGMAMTSACSEMSGRHAPGSWEAADLSLRC